MTLTETVYGVQAPRFLHTPAGVVDNRAAEAAELMAAVGMPLDPWQVTTLEAWLGERADGTWAATQAGTLVSRQNGKNAILEARELAGLFLFGERRIVHSAHEGDTAREAYKRMCALIESVPWLDSEVAKMPKSPSAAIILKSGAELSYRTRTKGGGRGFSAPVVILDEAQELTGEQLAAIQPLVSSYPRRQLIYTGTVLTGATVFQGVVERGRKGLSQTLGYTEFSAEEGLDPHDPEQFLQGSLMSNPSVGHRMTVEAIRDEWETAVSAHTIDKFLQERWSVWPDVAASGQMIPVPAWMACLTGWRPEPSQLVEHIGVASSVDGAWSSVGIAFQRGSKTFVEVVKHEPGTEWVIPYVAGLCERRRPRAVVMDKGGPASKSLANGLTAVGLPLRETSTAEMQAATAQFVDAVLQGRVEHTGQGPLDAAAAGVREKLVGDARMFDRRKSGAVISPIEAVTLAAWGLSDPSLRPSKYETGDLLVF